MAPYQDLDDGPSDPAGVPRQQAAPKPPRVALGWIRRILSVLLAALVFATALRSLMQPNDLLSGGVAGTSLLLNRLAGLPLGATIAALNVPIFLIGIRDMGRRFALLSALGVAATWVFADAVPFEPLTNDPLLAGVFGGVLSGIGTALALRGGGSLGGFDILGLAINRRFGVGVGEVLLGLNGILVVVAGILGSPELAMYTLVSIYAAGKAVDAILAPKRRRACMIVTRHPEPIRERVLSKMDRGMTVFHGHGAYTKAEITTLLCVVTRQEIAELTDIVRQEDAHAFVVVLDAAQVIGSFRGRSAAAFWKKLHDPLSPQSRNL